MTRKERILKAIRREPVDCVPFATYNFHGCGCNEHVEDASYRDLQLLLCHLDLHIRIMKAPRCDLTFFQGGGAFHVWQRGVKKD